MINDFFNWCVLVLEIMAEYTGMSYELINILIFVILQPSVPRFPTKMTSLHPQLEHGD